MVIEIEFKLCAFELLLFCIGYLTVLLYLPVSCVVGGAPSGPHIHCECIYVQDPEQGEVQKTVPQASLQALQLPQ